MAKIKLAEIAKKLNKTGLQIAADTGLNRNTISALLSGKTEGIRLSTLEKICNTYKMPLESLVELSLPEKQKQPKLIEHPYKQEGECVPFTVFQPFIEFDSPRVEGKQYGTIPAVVYNKKEYFEAYIDKEAMERTSEAIYEKWHAHNALLRPLAEFRAIAAELEAICVRNPEKLVPEYSKEKLAAVYTELKAKYRDFWMSGVFIDSFDCGFDAKTIHALAEKYGLSLSEVSALTTPTERVFTEERLLAFLHLVRKIRAKGATDKRTIRAALAELAPDVQAYIDAYSYYKSNYAYPHHIDEDEIVEEALIYLKEPKRIDEEIVRLETYEEEHLKNEKKILATHQLTENPLQFFQTLTLWRELRKKSNLIGIHLHHALLRGLERESGIGKRFLNQLVEDEYLRVLEGFNMFDTLKRRYEIGVAMYKEDGSYRLIEAEEARSVRDELQARLLGKNAGEVITGKVASQGYAKGIARIVFGREDFDSFAEGEILVTGMTRPEFVPLMKRAAAIVTNEGGITCHAAIVSRELGKPCIIGTQVATQLIRNGDFIEVRANHGTVRILNRGS